MNRGSFYFRTLPLDLVSIAAGAAAAFWRPSPQWVENVFTNGYYPYWQHFWSLFTPYVPFSIGDVVVLIGVVIVIAAIVSVRPWWRALIGIAALAGFYSLWFYAGWAFGYDRAPVEVRADFDASRLNPAAIDALRTRAIAQMNRLARQAHAAHDLDGAEWELDVDDLRLSWLPVVARLGDRWLPQVNESKFTLAGWFMDRSGTSGFTNPFTLETQLAPDLLWFELPFSQAHEWSHVAGFNREDEANYIAAVSCLRSDDAITQYSGWLELFLYLPQLKHYSRSTFVPQVWQDFAAIRRRNAHFVNLSLSRFSWRVYNNYLKTNHVASGVQNYDEVTRLMAAIPLDQYGLPRVRRVTVP
ncbi:MAG TPA: DUF3810 family protein [Candidatus Baltobacteraceae bacterium]|nr:DUF3810 family protein [Candidatus Baltobacteraceae bacterium]